MREEIEAAVTFLTRLLAKNVDPTSSNNQNASVSANGSSNNGTNSKETNYNKNDPPPLNNNLSVVNDTNNSSQKLTEEKIKKFSQKLIDILTTRFQNHWYPSCPSKGQAYRCIRINQNCRVDCSIELACQQSGINYESLRLPVELTLWIDPSEVTCRFGEHKGSFCVVAKLRDGRQENYVDSINIEELEQRSIDRSKQVYFSKNSVRIFTHFSFQTFENSRLKMKSHTSNQQRQSILAGQHGHHSVGSVKQAARQQVATTQLSQFSTTSSNPINSNVVSYHAINGGVNTLQNNGLNSHGSPVSGTLTNGFGVEFASLGAPSSNGLPSAVFGTGVGSGSSNAGLSFQPNVTGQGSVTSSQQFQYSSSTHYFNAAYHQQAANFQHHHQQQSQVVAAVASMNFGSPGSHLFNTNPTTKYLQSLTGSPQHNSTSSTPPTSVGGGQLQAGGSSARSLSNHLSSTSLTGGSTAFRTGQMNNSIPSISAVSNSSSQASTSKPNHSQLSSSNSLTNGSLSGNNVASVNPTNSSNCNNGGGGGANPNAPLFIPRGYLLSQFNLSAPPFTPAGSFGNSNFSLFLNFLSMLY
ncbi:B-cell translocation protein-like protein [Sarcoptes scabiei]|uniref:B-cell translocation protein-like protein n=1 Tax=Sarcoptes scabiei TaxID=52283 RepID=A0A131ZVE1_SARSC|nr:B-cell translocation protein-like protein [Sarcoptes scabiei]